MNFEEVYNIGKIVLRDDECFWIFNPGYIFRKCNLFIHSPSFYYLREKWRLVMWSSESSNNGYTNLYLWREFRHDLPKCKYTVQFQMLTIDGKKRIGYFKGELDYDYGFAAFEFCSKKDINENKVFKCGLIKIFFVINRSIDDSETGASDANSIEDDISWKYETSSEDEVTSDEENSEKKNVSPEIKGIRILSENLKQILLDGRMSDAVLKVDSRDFNVHKIILVARSPVFASMFEHDLTEKKSNVVDIPDCTAESFEVFLHYIYSGSIGALSTNNVHDVYYAADKYHIDDLKEKCVEFMTNNISEETFCDVIALSLRHAESNLQKIATDFFCQNMKKIIKTVQWQIFLRENSTQANELLIKALSA